jgi:hypothetical protein
MAWEPRLVGRDAQPLCGTGKPGSVILKPSYGRTSPPLDQQDML